MMTDASGVRNLDFAVKSRFDTPEHDQFQLDHYRPSCCVLDEQGCSSVRK